MTTIAPNLTTQAKAEGKRIIVKAPMVTLYGFESQKVDGGARRTARIAKALGGKVVLQKTLPKHAVSARGRTVKELAAEYTS